MNNYRNFLRNVLSNWAGFLINIVIAFFLSPFIVHKLGNVYYGLWIILMQFSGYLGILELGVRSSLVKYVAEYIAQKEHIKLNNVISIAITIYSSVAIIAFLISLFIAFLFSQLFNFPGYTISNAKFLIVIIGINVGLGFVFNVFYGILMGVQRYDIYNKVMIAFTFLKSLAIVCFLYNDFGIISLGIIQLISGIISNFVTVYYCKKTLPQLRINYFFFDKNLFKQIFNYSYISFFVNASQKIIFQTDAIIIGVFLDAIQITYYSIPATLVEYLRRFVIGMTQIFVPMTSEFEAKKDRKSIVDILFNGTKISLIIALPICVVFFFKGKEFILLWMGEEYAKNGDYVLKVLAVTNLLSMIHLASREILLGMALHRFNALCYGIEAAANFFLSIVLIRYYGIIGVAIGTAIPHALNVIFVFPIMMKRILYIKYMDFLKKAIIPPIIACLPFVGYCIFIGNYNKLDTMIKYFAVITCGLPVYMLSIIFICLKTDERNKLKRILLGNNRVEIE
jgi:O-antigen/teichoic acid export membrane protein